MFHPSLPELKVGYTSSYKAWNPLLHSLCNSYVTIRPHMTDKDPLILILVNIQSPPIQQHGANAAEIDGSGSSYNHRKIDCSPYLIYLQNSFQQVLPSALTMDSFIGTPLASLPGQVEDLKVTFQSRKTYDIEFRKAQLKRFWALADVSLISWSSHTQVTDMIEGKRGSYSRSTPSRFGKATHRSSRSWDLNVQERNCFHAGKTWWLGFSRTDICPRSIPRTFTYHL